MTSISPFWIQCKSIKIYLSWHVQHVFWISVISPVINTAPLGRTVNFLFFLFFLFVIVA
jgi:hypothetical protein